MTSLLAEAQRRIRLVGYNRLELLLFRLDTHQLFAINVFKVREVMMCPALSWVPNSHPATRGIANVRGKTVPIIDLNVAVGRPGLDKPEQGFLVLTEFNRSVQGFLVNALDRIVNLRWDAVSTPPPGMEEDAYLTAITEIGGEMVEVIDVERVLVEVLGHSEHVSAELTAENEALNGGVRQVLVVDDSSVARKQMTRTLEQINVSCVLARNGLEALEVLDEMKQRGSVYSQIAMVITDIEMPEMDGYTFTSRIRQDPELQDLHIMMHSSLSGVFNNAMVEKVRADQFIAKFSSDELAQEVLKHINAQMTHAA